MELEKSRCGFYTLTFLDSRDMSLSEILKEFNTVGKVSRVTKKFQRAFVRYSKKEDAIKALEKYGKLFGLTAARNSERSNESNAEVTSVKSNNFNDCSNPSLPASPTCGASPQVNYKSIKKNQSFNLILGNLPSNYGIEDVRSLVEEANPLFINELDETKILNLKFCVIALGSIGSLTYLVKKLDGFVISSEKLIAIEEEKLLKLFGTSWTAPVKKL